MSRCRRNTSVRLPADSTQLVLPVRRVRIGHLDLGRDPVQQQVEQLVLVRHVGVERGRCRFRAPRRHDACSRRRARPRPAVSAPCRRSHRGSAVPAAHWVDACASTPEPAVHRRRWESSCPGPCRKCTRDERCLLDERRSLAVRCSQSTNSCSRQTSSEPPGVPDDDIDSNRPAPATEQHDSIARHHCDRERRLARTAGAGRPVRDPRRPR